MTIESLIPHTSAGRSGEAHRISAFLARASLGPEEREALDDAAGPPRTIARGQCILEQGALPTALSILCSGVAQSARSLADGRREADSSLTVWFAGRSVQVFLALSALESLLIFAPLVKFNSIIGCRFPLRGHAYWLPWHSSQFRNHRC
jgi:hypothetical protein